VLKVAADGVMRNHRSWSGGGVISAATIVGIGMSGQAMTSGLADGRGGKGVGRSCATKGDRSWGNNGGDR
jgi:hypothetical protein